MHTPTPARQVETQSRQLEDERGKVAQLKRDMDGFRRKAKAEQEKAAKMVRMCRVCVCEVYVFVFVTRCQ